MMMSITIQMMILIKMSYRDLNNDSNDGNFYKRFKKILMFLISMKDYFKYKEQENDDGGVY